MTNYPTSIKQYIVLGKLLADTLNIRVAYASPGQHSDFGSGWSHQGSNMFGVSNGNFQASEEAYADLAALCMDACYSDDNRYKDFLTDAGRATILASIHALSSIDDIVIKSRSRESHS